MSDYTQLQVFALPKAIAVAQAMVKNMTSIEYGCYLLYIQSLWLANENLEYTLVCSENWRPLLKFDQNRSYSWTYPSVIGESRIAYRIKAEPAKVPWTRETVPNGLAWVRYVRQDNEERAAVAVTKVGKSGLTVGQTALDYVVLANHYHWSESFNGPWKECVTIES